MEQLDIQDIQYADNMNGHIVLTYRYIGQR